MKLLVVRVLLRLFSWISPRVAELIAPPVAALVWYLSARKRRVTWINLQVTHPEMDHRQRRRIARASMVHYVRGVIEAGMLWYWPLEKIFARFDVTLGLENYRAAQRRGKGVIIAAPHSGAWELMGLYLQQEMVKAILYKPGQHADVEAMLLDSRRRNGAELVPANRSGLRALYKMLKAGETVGLLPDQEPSRGNGRFAPFYGVEALSGVLLPRLAGRTGAAVIFALCERLENGRYCVHMVSAEDAIYDADMRTALSAVNRGIEHCIEVDSRQYLWAYKRFRHRPDGEAPFYPSSQKRE